MTPSTQISQGPTYKVLLLLPAVDSNWLPCLLVGGVTKLYVDGVFICCARNLISKRDSCATSAWVRKGVQ